MEDAEDDEDEEDDRCHNTKYDVKEAIIIIWHVCKIQVTILSIKMIYRIHSITRTCSN